MSVGGPSGKAAGRDGNRRPFTNTELEAYFASLEGLAAVGVAVSGGADSTALMVLVRRWLDRIARSPPQVTVLTVDHGLRAEAAAEAEWVAAQSAKLGFEHRTLHWQGDKPATGIQVAARAARYRLLSDHCRKHDVNALLVAHTSDDQAETLMMRLARGSGVDGLSAMAPISRQYGITLIRPLLGTSRARLEAMLKEEEQSWLEDPSNDNEAYERIAVRRALKHLEKLGICGDALSRSAARLARVRRALEAATDRFLDTAVTLHDAGYALLNDAEWNTAEAEIALRALRRLAGALGGTTAAPDLSQIEAVYEKLQSGAKRLTLGGCLFFRRRGGLYVAREHGRITVPASGLPPGEAREWDMRFCITLRAEQGDVHIRPLGPEGYKAVKAAQGGFGDVPREAALALPSLWCGKELFHAPCTVFEHGAPSYWLREVEIVPLPQKRLFADRIEIAD